MRFLKEYSFAIWLGISLAAFAHMNIWQWEYYAILIPLVVLVVWKAEHDQP